MTDSGGPTVEVRKLRERWVSRRDELARLKALLDAASLCEEFVADPR